MPSQRDIITIQEDIVQKLTDLATLQGGGDTTALLTAIKDAVDTLETLITSTNTHVDQLEGYTDGVEGKLDILHTDLTSQATAAKQDIEATKLDTVHTDLLRLAPLGPGPGTATPSTSKIFGFAFTANTAGNFDLSGANYVGLKTAIDAGKLLVLKATTGCYYNWATASITIAAASTAVTNPATQGVPMFDGGESPERAPAATTWLNVLGGAVAGTLYAYIAE